jgi:hypothetical protein
VVDLNLLNDALQHRNEVVVLLNLLADGFDIDDFVFLDSIDLIAVDALDLKRRFLSTDVYFYFILDNIFVFV